MFKVSCVECFQKPCQITDQTDQPKESLTNSCKPKKPAPECCVAKSQDHGFVGMKELAKPGKNATNDRNDSTATLLQISHKTLHVQKESNVQN